VTSQFDKSALVEVGRGARMGCAQLDVRESASVFEPETFEELLAATPQELATADIARVNLLCATGLRGAENLDIPACLATIDGWTEEVRQFTAWNFLHVFKPKTARDTPGFLRFWSMVKLLRHHKGLEHALCPKDLDPEEKLVVLKPDGEGPESTYYNSDLVFIHGLLGDRKLGICTTFPVLFAAVGRRLGYPLKLVLTVSHVFTRWDDPADTFNIDATSSHITVEPTERYIDKPRPWTDHEKSCPALLRPLTRLEEFAAFLGWRANTLAVNERYDEAEEMCDRAAQLFPDQPIHWLARKIDRGQVRVFMEKDDWGYEIPEPDESQGDETTPEPEVVDKTVNPAG